MKKLLLLLHAFFATERMRKVCSGRQAQRRAQRSKLVFAPELRQIGNLAKTRSMVRYGGCGYWFSRLSQRSKHDASAFFPLRSSKARSPVMCLQRSREMKWLRKIQEPFPPHPNLPLNSLFIKIRVFRSKRRTILGCKNKQDLVPCPQATMWFLSPKSSTRRREDRALK